MRPTRHRHQLQPSRPALPPHHLPRRHRRPTMLTINHLHRLTPKLRPHRKIDRPALNLNTSINKRNVHLPRQPILKLHAQRTVRLFVERTHHHPRRVHIQPMHHDRPGTPREQRLHPAANTIRLVTRPPRHAQKPRRLINRHPPVPPRHNPKPLRRRIHTVTKITRNHTPADPRRGRVLESLA